MPRKTEETQSILPKPRINASPPTAPTSRPLPVDMALLRSWWSPLTFEWVTPLLALGRERPLGPEDLADLPIPHRPACAHATFAAIWVEETQRGGRHRHHGIHLAVALVRVLGGRLLLTGLLKLVASLLQFVAPLTVRAMVQYVQTPGATIQEGLGYALLVLASGIIGSLVETHYVFLGNELGWMVRGAVLSATFEHAFEVTPAALQARSTGEMINLATTDAQRLQEMTMTVHNCWGAVLQILLGGVLLWREVGMAAVAAGVVILLGVPSLVLLAKRVRRDQVPLMEARDERVQACQELLTGIKMLKLQAWEGAFADRINRLRDTELDFLRKYVFAFNVSNTLFVLVPVVIGVATLITYGVSLGRTLDVATTLATLSLISQVRGAIFSLPNLVSSVVETGISLSRISSFLAEGKRMKYGTGELRTTGIHIRNADFRWDTPPERTELDELLEGASISIPENPSRGEPALHHITFFAEPGQLHAVVGTVGSGKTTFLAGIVGEARCCAGSVAIRGTVAYVPQVPFILNATVRENICFGSDFHRERYEEAIQACCLAKDLVMFPDGDQTEIGERGITLSGGQRLRLALARAVYRDADIYILDDILSAVDVKVGKAIFMKCIKKALSMKIVVLATHSLDMLKHCDNVVVLGNSTVIECGTFKKLVAEKKWGILAAMVETGSKAGTANGKTHSELDDEPGSEDVDEGDIYAEFGNAGQEIKRSDSEHLTGDEDRSDGVLALDVFSWWTNTFGGVPLLGFVILLYACAQATSLLALLWISSSGSTSTLLVGYIGCNTAYVAFVFVRAVVLLKCCLNASSCVFGTLVRRLARAPMSFFDSTPIGQPLNQVSRDIIVIDEGLAGSWSLLLSNIVKFGLTLGMMMSMTPLMTIAVVPLALWYARLQSWFIGSSHSLQRLEAISRSPVLSSFTEILDGMATIRSFNSKCVFTKKFDIRLYEHQKAWMMKIGADCWIGLRLELFGAVVSAGAVLAAIHVRSTGEVTSVGSVGVAIMYTFALTDVLSTIVRMSNQLQTQMISVERVKSYCEMPVEAPLDCLPQLRPPDEWPAAGRITFDNVSLRYRFGLPRVLKGISLIINAGERIGIVGRTGAGKSTFLLCLTRLVELSGGAITIDGVDISTIGLHDLRAKLAVIPQEPILFAGSLRSNIDLFCEHSDDDIWEALRKAQLLDAVMALDEPVREGGSNYSVGERQLICIARAFLRHPRIILMDEATASIDVETEAKLQHSINAAFEGKTRLTIAHRLSTVNESDRVLVLDNGEVVEVGPPRVLQKKSKGHFRALMEEWKHQEKTSSGRS